MTAGRRSGKAVPVQLTRSALTRCRLLAVAILFGALLLRLAVPAGFMPVLEDGGPTLTICPGWSSDTTATARPGMATMNHHRENAPQPPGGCAFADLALAMVAPPELLQPGAVIAWPGIMSAGKPPTPSAASIGHLRPPLRGPPPLA
jgi:hypothetical protein